MLPLFKRAVPPQIKRSFCPTDTIFCICFSNPIQRWSYRASIPSQSNTECSKLHCISIVFSQQNDINIRKQNNTHIFITTNIPINQHTSTSPFPAGVTTSIFPPFPRDIPYSTTCFSFTVSCHIPVDNLLNRGFSKKLAVFNRMLVEHVKSMPMSPHDDMKHITSQAQTGSSSSSARVSSSSASPSSASHIQLIPPDCLSCHSMLT